jgi:hypothetical protein
LSSIPCTQSHNRRSAKQRLSPTSLLAIFFCIPAYYVFCMSSFDTLGYIELPHRSAMLFKNISRISLGGIISCNCGVVRAEIHKVLRTKHPWMVTARPIYSQVHADGHTTRTTFRAGCTPMFAGHQVHPERLTSCEQTHTRTKRLTWKTDRSSKPNPSYTFPFVLVGSKHTVTHQQPWHFQHSNELSMESPAMMIPDRNRQGREPLPNLRGEDEAEISYLSNLIESMNLAVCLACFTSCTH